MKNPFDYILFRVYEHFTIKKKSSPKFETSFFLSLFMMSLLIPLMMLVNLFVHFDLKDYIGNVEFEDIKYKYILPIAIIYLFIFNKIIKNKLKSEKLEILKEKYHKEKYRINIWIIFLAPIFFIFVSPIIYGWLNGTLTFNAPKNW